jgi:hypothetical protein
MRIRSGWWTFAAVMLLTGGVLNAFDGLVGVTQTRYIERNTGGQLPLTNDVKNWAWAELIVGIVMVLAAMGIFSGANWGRIIGIVLASLNLLFQFAYLGHYPFWSFTMIVIDILIIYGLAGSSEVYEEEVL